MTLDLPDLHAPTNTDAARLASVRAIRDTGPEVIVEYEDQQRTARKTMPIQYHAEPGDTLLAAMQGDQCYIIGVIHGQGTTSLINNGDVTLQSRQGKVHIQGHQSVEVTTPRMSIRTLLLDTTARDIVEKAVEVCRSAAGRMRFRASEVRTEARGTVDTVADSVSVRAKNRVKVDGERIDLG